MKKLFRMVVFSAIAIYLTSLWNKGFIIHSDWQAFLKAAIIVALVYYLIIPITKIILLPFNILTLGLVSTLVYFFLFYFFTNKFNLIQINPWVFSGISFLGINIQKVNISSLGNIILSSLSVSTIISFLERIL